MAARRVGTRRPAGADVTMLGAMRLRPLLVAIITCLGLAACGGASHSATSSTSAATSTGPSQVAAATTTFSVSGEGPAVTTTTTSATAPPEVPRTETRKGDHASGGGGQTSGGGQSGASQGAHVQSNLTVAANGDVSPPLVSVPSGVGVELHVTNHRSSAATVALSVPSHPSAHIAPGASATLQTAGLKDGTYRILVNGTPRGQLMIGAQGGP